MSLPATLARAKASLDLALLDGSIVLPGANDTSGNRTARNETSFVNVDPPAQARVVPDGLEAANRSYEEARRGVNGASWATARSLYQDFLKNPGSATALDRAEATFFLARCLQQERLLPGARHAFTQLLDNADFAASPFRVEAAFRLGEISHQAGGYELAIRELQRCRDLLRAAPDGSVQGDFTRWILPLQADAQAREGNFRAARELFQESLTGTPPEAISTFVKQGLARMVLSSGRAAASASGEEQARLFVEARTALQLLQKQFPNDEITATTLRGLAGISYDQANTGTNRASWERAREFFTQVHALGERSPHRADALYFLGWCEFRLGNFSAAESHFSAFATLATTDSRRTEAQSLRAIANAENHVQQAGQASGENAARDRVTHYRAALEVLAGINDPARAEYVRSLGTRTARTLIPLLDPDGQPQQFTDSLQHTRTILGDRYPAAGIGTLLYNTGRTLLHPATGTASAENRTRGLTYLRAAAADAPRAQSGLLSAMEVARATGDFRTLATSSQQLLETLGPLTEANRAMWTYATTQRINGLLGNAQVRDAQETFTTAETALRDAPQGVRDQFRANVWNHFVENGERMLSKPTPTAAELQAAEQSFRFIMDAEGTRGTLLRARSVYGSAQVLERQGTPADALTRYRQIGLLYPATRDGKPAFAGEAFDQLRTNAENSVRRLSER